MKAIKRLVNKINIYKEIMVAINDKMEQDFSISIEDKYTAKIDNEEYEVYKDTKFLRTKGIMVAGAVKVNPENPRYVIVVDDYFFKFSEEGQSFLLHHEVGHIKYKHLDLMEEDPIKYMKDRSKGSKDSLSTKLEKEADMYSAFSIGKEKTLKGLNELNNFYLNFGKNNELKARIDFIDKTFKR